MLIKTWVLRHIFKYTSPFISLIEKQQLRKYGLNDTNISPIFIVGAPRTGSTILYQLITQYFDTLYFDNLIHFNRENVLFGFKLSRILYRDKAHNSFRSKLGNTEKEGLHAPSEAGQIWQKWLQNHSSYNIKNNIQTKDKEVVRKYINSITNKYQKNLVIKNNYNSLRIPFLKEINPTSKFIFIKRDPFFTAQSIIKARKEMFNDVNQWWSVKPYNFEQISNLPYLEQIVKQIYYIEKQIHEDLLLISSENKMIIKYNQLNNQEWLISEMKSFCKEIKLRKDFTLKEININKKIVLEPDLVKILKAEISKYDWDNYKS